MPFMDKWELNGTEILLQDEGRDKANGVPVLDGNAKLPLKYITPAYSENLKVSPNDPYDMTLMEWAYYLSSDGYRNPGKAWSACAGITGGTEALKGVAYGNSLYVSASKTKIFTSLDGRRWIDTWSIPTNCYALTFLNGLFLCLCYRYVYWSIDGVTWNTCSGLSNSESYATILYNNGHFVLRSGDNVYWSINGKSWNVVSNIGQNTAIDYEGGMWFACLYDLGSALNGVPWYSTDGETWTKGSGSSIVARVYYGNSVWIGVAFTNRVCWSEDGINWTDTITTGFTLSGTNVTYANGLWVIGGREIVSQTYFPYWSTDGKTWSKGTGTGDLGDIGAVRLSAYANNIWIMIMAGSLCWSTDGKAWTLCTGAESNINNVNYINNMWLAVGQTSIYWSLDGKTWVQGLGANSNKKCKLPSYYASSIYLSISDSSPYDLWFSGSSLWTPN